MDGQGVSCPFLRFIVHSARTSVPDLLDRLFGQHVQRISVLAATLSPMSTCLNPNERQKKKEVSFARFTVVSSSLLPPLSFLPRPRQPSPSFQDRDHSRPQQRRLSARRRGDQELSLCLPPRRSKARPSFTSPPSFPITLPPSPPFYPHTQL